MPIFRKNEFQGQIESSESVLAVAMLQEAAFEIYEKLDLDDLLTNIQDQVKRTGDGISEILADQTPHRKRYLASIQGGYRLGKEMHRITEAALNFVRVCREIDEARDRRNNTAGADGVDRKTLELKG